jgi:hypothetical protein
MGKWSSMRGVQIKHNSETTLATPWIRLQYWSESRMPLKKELCYMDNYFIRQLLGQLKITNIKKILKIK